MEEVLLMVVLVVFDILMEAMKGETEALAEEVVVVPTTWVREEEEGARAGASLGSTGAPPRRVCRRLPPVKARPCAPRASPITGPTYATRASSWWMEARRRAAFCAGSTLASRTSSS